MVSGRSAYDAKGYFEKNDRGLFVNNLTAKPNPDGSVTVQFGGCRKDMPLCRSWRAGTTVRLYRHGRISSTAPEIPAGAGVN
jgi:hypothetical protein